MSDKNNPYPGRMIEGNPQETGRVVPPDVFKEINEYHAAYTKAFREKFGYDMAIVVAPVVEQDGTLKLYPQMRLQELVSPPITSVELNHDVNDTSKETGPSDSGERAEGEAG